MAREEIDRLAVQRDAALVHALATRTLPPDEVDIDHPIVTCLASWVDWVDAGIDDSVTFELPDHKDRVVQLSDRRHSRAGLIAGSTVVALLVSSGAAAAVTGDPFIVAKAPFKVIEQVNPFDDEHDAREQLPDQAPDVADANKLLADAQRALANGDPERAQLLLAQVTALLGDGANPGQQHRIDKLTDHINSGSGRPDSAGNGPRDHGQSGDPGHGNKNSHANTGGSDKPDNGPRDNDPVDNDPNGANANDNDPADNDPGQKTSPNSGDHTNNGGTGGQGTDEQTNPPTGGGNPSHEPKGAKGSGKSGRGAGADKTSKDTGGGKSDKGAVTG